MNQQTKTTEIRGTSKPTERDYKINELYVKICNTDKIKITNDDMNFILIEIWTHGKAPTAKQELVYDYLEARGFDISEIHERVNKEEGETVYQYIVYPQ